jgi:H+-transporting ATPase
VIVEAGIQNWIDFGILLFIQFANATIGFYEMNKAGDAVAALKASLKPVATCKRDGKWKNMDGAEIVPGDLVLLAAGSAVPADCRLNEGQIEVDQAALTGESLPVTMFQGASAKMGSTVVRGEQESTVEFTGADTFLGKTAALLGGTAEHSNFQVFLMRIVKVLVGLSITLCGIVLAYLSIQATFVEALGFTIGNTHTYLPLHIICLSVHIIPHKYHFLSPLFPTHSTSPTHTHTFTPTHTTVLLIASIPMAIEIVTTTTLALGSKELSHDGAIVTRLAAIEDMAAMSILCSDKTGTLTMNKMVIQEETPVFAAGETQYSLLRYAAMATKWHEPPRDALDTLTLGAVDLPSLDLVTQLAYMPFDPIVKRTEGTVRLNATGAVFKTSKGAPHVMLNLILDAVQAAHKDGEESDRAAAMQRYERLKSSVEADIESFGLRGIRTLAVAKSSDVRISSTGELASGLQWEFLGLLTFLDPPRPDTKQTIADATRYGVKVKMITGDHLLIAKETARVLEMGDYIKSSAGLPMLDPVTKAKPDNLSRDFGDCCLAVDGFAQVYPEHKYLIVECLREMGYKVGMTGDGVNDAPALKRADVGVAVQGATDAARAAADIVLTRPGLSTIVTGITVSRKIFARIRSFLTYRIAATLQLLIFFFIAVLAFEPVKHMPADWETNPDFPDSKEWPDFFSMPVLMLMLITLLNDGTLIAIGYDNAVARETPEKWNMMALFFISSILASVACVSSLLLLLAGLESWEAGSVFQVWGIGGLSYGQIITMMCPRGLLEKSPGASREVPMGFVRSPQEPLEKSPGASREVPGGL